MKSEIHCVVIHIDTFWVGKGKDIMKYLNVLIDIIYLSMRKIGKSVPTICRYYLEVRVVHLYLSLNVIIFTSEYKIVKKTGVVLKLRGRLLYYWLHCV